MFEVLDSGSGVLGLGGLRVLGFGGSGVPGERKIWMKPFLDENVVDETVLDETVIG